MSHFKVFFSIVTYHHPLSSIKPLLVSLSELVNSSSTLFEFEFLFHENISGRQHLNLAVLSSEIINASVHYEVSANIGFGSAHNMNFSRIEHVFHETSLFVICNPDVSFEAKDLCELFAWVLLNPYVSGVAPLIFNPSGSVQYSAKFNPTFLSLLLGRFQLLRVFPPFHAYYSNHTSFYLDYESSIVPSTYLSGSFLVVPCIYYNRIGGFDENFFLHLEDADFTRRLSQYGLTLHVPIASIMHQWARGSHSSLKQMFLLFKSYIYYISKWGFTLF